MSLVGTCWHYYFYKNTTRDMANSYDAVIMTILSEVGENGISVQKLSMHVYNQCCSLFDKPDVKEVHRYVQQFLTRNSKKKYSLVENMSRRGYYRLNHYGRNEIRQMMLSFDKDERCMGKDEPRTPNLDVDLSLSLFD